MISREQLLTLVDAGIQAPSADNMQPWKFRLMIDGLELYPESKINNLFFDFKNTATLISLGAVVENISIAAEELGLRMDCHFMNNIPGIPIALKFQKGDSKKHSSLYSAIFKRCTDRNIYKFGTKIHSEIISRLTKCVTEHQSYSVHNYQNKIEKNKITKLIYQTDAIRFSHERIHEDFYSILRFNNNTINYYDGLAVKTLGVESFFIPALKILQPWDLTKFLNIFGLHHIMSFRSTLLPMISASTIMAITHAGPPDYFEFGRVMQRFWLQATKEGLSVQPLGALPLLLTRIKTSLENGFNGKQISQLKSIRHQFAMITPGFEEKNHHLVMPFRLGYSSKQTPRSLRRPLESFLF